MNDNQIKIQQKLSRQPLYQSQFTQEASFCNPIFEHTYKCL
jgi:hypothetical protein